MNANADCTKARLAVIRRNGDQHKCRIGQQRECERAGEHQRLRPMRSESSAMERVITKSTPAPIVPATSACGERHAELSHGDVGMYRNRM